MSIMRRGSKRSMRRWKSLSGTLRSFPFTESVFSWGIGWVAFSICSRVNSEQFTVHFEKNDPEFKGSGQIVNQETARALLPFGKYINREQDLGIEGLRHAKMSYRPLVLLRNCNLIPLE